MKIDQLPELQEISLIQARTAANRIEGQAIITATNQLLAELKADIDIKTEN